MGALNWEKIKEILGSKAFENVAGVAGAGVSAYAGAQQADANNKQRAAEFAAQMALTQRSQQENQRQGAATSAAAASPLGANEDFATKQAIRNMVLSGLRNPSVAASDPGVAAAMPKITPAFQLPQGGIPREALAHLSPQATAGAIAQRQQHVTNIDPNAPGVNFERMGFDPATAAGPQQETNAFQGAAQGRQAADNAAMMQQLQAALSQNYAAGNAPEQKKSGGFLSKLGGALKFAAPIAAMAIPGLGPLAAAGIAGGGTALGSKMQGNSLGNSLSAGAASAGGSMLTRGRPQQPQAPRTPSFAGNMPGVDPNVLAAALRRGQFGR